MTRRIATMRGSGPSGRTPLLLRLVALLLGLGVGSALALPYGRVRPDDNKRITFEARSEREYLVGGQPNAPIELTRGDTYLLELVDSDTHPLFIKSSDAPKDEDAIGRGILHNGTSKGRIVLQVSEKTPDTLYYSCGRHALMRGTIHIVDADR